MDPITLFVLWSVMRGSGGGSGPAWPTPQDPPPVPSKARGKPKRPKHKPSPPAPPAPGESQIAPGADAAPPVPTPVAPPKAVQPADTRREGDGMQATPVLTLQKLINRHGARPQLKPDGLFGPKTVTAWRSLAAARGLNPRIVRLSPKSADVARATYARLNASTVTSGDFDRPLYIP